MGAMESIWAEEWDLWILFQQDPSDCSVENNLAGGGGREGKVKFVYEFFDICPIKKLGWEEVPSPWTAWACLSLLQPIE